MQKSALFTSAFRPGDPASDVTVECFFLTGAPEKIPNSENATGYVQLILFL